MIRFSAAVPLVLGGLGLFVSSPVRAQAFTQADGEGRIIATVIYSHSDKGFDDNADTIDIADYDKTEIYLLGEYGITDDLTLLVTPSLRNVSLEGGDDSTSLGYTDLGARYRVSQTDNLVLSVQALARIPGNTQRNSFAQIGQTGFEFDLRGQAGLSFGQGSFLIAEGGYRLRSGDPPNEFHIDATVGVRATDKLLLIANSYNTISDGRGSGIFSKHRYHNVYLSAAYDVSPRVTLQLGAMGTVAGRNALRERGLFAGVWFRFP